MCTALKLRLANPKFTSYSSLGSVPRRCLYHLRLPIRLHPCLAVHSHYDSAGPPQESEPSSISSQYIASVGISPFPHSTLQLSQWNFTQRHILILNVIACAVAVSATWLFFSAIPTLLAFKRAAESLEKLMDATREELPDTMAAIRLSGMEISDLTMELSDLGQEITQGVRSSTRAVRLAEERLRSLTNMAPPASLQRVTSPKTETGGPALARSARGMRESIVKGRSILQMFFTIVHFSRMAFNYFAKRAKQKSQSPNA
ncbi:hypothetical protein P3X46_012871 [Hevea brasiliensis]|uniref:Transmembrane protein n=1 Tax=Hevea brasiliensis TaxID=3981 RepID=A0ABQ9MBK0_HEVBR|nr:uncharacterized protein LOC110642778 isoform X1 [Hevea brasiliensis]XP_021650611.2 uncharacterized protein LOC110642778 isoform X1 [Hevea brasiliensis]KAJ9177679.1 hypothetical protein P3X46_012871 [Hevea brasiliensis]